MEGLHTCGHIIQLVLVIIAKQSLSDITMPDILIVMDLFRLYVLGTDMMSIKRYAEWLLL